MTGGGFPCTGHERAKELFRITLGCRFSLSLMIIDGTGNKNTLVQCTIRYVVVRVMVFNATFNNISVISWLLVLLVEETGVPREIYQPVTSY